MACELAANAISFLSEATAGPKSAAAAWAARHTRRAKVALMRWSILLHEGSTDSAHPPRRSLHRHLADKPLLKPSQMTLARIAGLPGPVGIGIGGARYRELRFLNLIGMDTDGDPVAVARGLWGDGSNPAYTYQQYVEDVLNIWQPDIVIHDHYPFNETRNPLRFRLSSTFYRDMGIIRAAALKRGRPYWKYLQAYGKINDKAVPSKSQSRLEMTLTRCSRRWAAGDFAWCCNWLAEPETCSSTTLEHPSPESMTLNPGSHAGVGSPRSCRCGRPHPPFPPSISAPASRHVNVLLSHESSGPYPGNCTRSGPMMQRIRSRVAGQIALQVG